MLRAAFTAAGAVLVLIVLIMTIRGAFRVAGKAFWAQRSERETYVAFAWQEVGRGIFLGYFFALGISPVIEFFFDGQSQFWQKFFLLMGINWIFAAIVIYLSHLIPGFRGYVLRERTRSAEVGVGLFGQVLIVTAMSLPLIWILVYFLLPPASEFFGILFETWRLYWRIYM